MKPEILETLTNANNKPVMLEVRRADGVAFYFMSGPTGEHRIAGDSDAKRLAAHWAGFCQLNDCKNREMLKGDANPNRVKASSAVLASANRCRVMLDMVGNRLANYEAHAGNLKSDWGHAGDVSNIREKLLDLVSDDDNREAVAAEIDNELEGLAELEA